MVACGWGGRSSRWRRFGNDFETESLPGALSHGRDSPQNINYALYAEQLPGTAFTAPHAVRAGSGPWYFLDARADLGRKLNDSKTKTMEAVGIEQPAVRPVPTILKRFRGQVSTRTRPKNTSETRCRTFL